MSAPKAPTPAAEATPPAADGGQAKFDVKPDQDPKSPGPPDQLSNRVPWEQYPVKNRRCRTEHVRADGDPSTIYGVAIDQLAENVKKLVAAGMGAQAAGELAFKVWCKMFCDD